MRDDRDVFDPAGSEPGVVRLACEDFDAHWADSIRAQQAEFRWAASARRWAGVIGCLALLVGMVWLASQGLRQ